jgi:15-cis-phytoene synthase
VRTRMALHSPALAASYHYCETVARREARNFYPAFRLLPKPQRLGMCALYTFMRIADDLSDEAGPTEEKRQRLAQWRRGLEAALAGHCQHPAHAALHDTVERYGIPREYLHAVLDGVEMDLEPVVYETFAELRLYCYRVASVVGLACIHIWGFDCAECKKYAEDAGIAFQLTNILRDLGEDAERGRVYLPREDLARFDYDGQSLKAGIRNQAYRELVRFEVERAREYYRSSWPLVARLAPSGRAVFLLMARTYRGLLDEIERRDYDVFSRRVRVSRWRKLMLALGVLPVRLGWIEAAAGG